MTLSPRQFDAAHFADHANVINGRDHAHPQIDGWLHASLLVGQLARQHGVPPVDVVDRPHPGQGSNFAVYRPKIDKRNAAIHIPTGNYHEHIDAVVAHEFAHHLDHVAGRDHQAHDPAFYERVADVYAALPKRWHG